MNKISRFIFLLAFIISSVSVSAQKYYITKTGSKYHTASCSYLKYSAFEISLNSAINKGYSACSRCSPDYNSSKSQLSHFTSSFNENIYNAYSNDCVTVQCSGITKKGYRCKNKTKDCSGRCYHHR